MYQARHVSRVCDLGNKRGVMEEIAMDVVVWTESEERERWWREIVGTSTIRNHCVPPDGGELPRPNLSTTSKRSESVATHLRAVAAA